MLLLCLKILQWIPITFIIKSRILTITHKALLGYDLCLSFQAPLDSLLHAYHSLACWFLEHTKLFPCRKTLEPDVPSGWNSLPSTLRSKCLLILHLSERLFTPDLPIYSGSALLTCSLVLPISLTKLQLLEGRSCICFVPNCTRRSWQKVRLLFVHAYTQVVHKERTQILLWSGTCLSLQSLH